MPNRLISLALAGALLFGVTSAAPAAQGTGCMPTTGTVSGLTFAQDVNAAIAALISSNSGASAPVTDCTAASIKGQVWLNTSVTPNAFQQYDGVSTWVTIGSLDATNHLFSPPIGGGTSTVVSASTVDLGALPTAVAVISGTTTIASFGSSAVVGTIHPVKFSGALTLTYNATSMILPNAVNKLTAANDVALAFYLGSGNWQVFDYQTASIATKASPTTSDFVLTLDAANNNAPAKSTVAQIAAVSQVTGIDSQTGAFTTANCIDSTSHVIEMTAACRTVPTTQVFTSGSGTYSPTSGNVKWIEVRMCGGGAGGWGSGGAGASIGGSGGATTFGGLTANGGNPGASQTAGGSGGTASGGFINKPGGQGGSSSTITTPNPGGQGGASEHGGQGAGGPAGAGPGATAQTNSCSGGGGGGANTTADSGAGGGSGAYLDAIINAPGSIAYAVGGGGSAGSAGTGGASGGGGGSGIIEVIEHYGI